MQLTYILCAESCCGAGLSRNLFFLYLGYIGIVIAVIQAVIMGLEAKGLLSMF